VLVAAAVAKVRGLLPVGLTRSPQAPADSSRQARASLQSMWSIRLSSIDDIASVRFDGMQVEERTVSGDTRGRLPLAFLFDAAGVASLLGCGV
jgi:hypothetical protein